MSKEIITSLEVLFHADTSAVDKAARDVESKAKKIESKPVKQKVDGDVKGALAGMDRVEAEAKKIVSAKTIATVDANIERAEKNLTRTQERLDYLRSVETDLEVTADIARAEKALERAERQRDALVSAKSKLVVEADTSDLDSLPEKAGAAGDDAGDAAGEGLSSGLRDALKAIPVAGGIILAGVAIGAAIADGIQDGMAQELGRDRLQALTGLEPAQAARMAAAAGEAYASVFGESIEANMDTARLALQFDLIDEDASVRDSQKVIQGLAGIADVLDEDVRPVAQAVTTMLRTGIVDTAEEAFDVLATGAREGVNAAEDLLDTFIEYPALFARLGLDADEALGLLNQGLEGGARNSDLVADALKEFQIRATDASETSAAGFAAIGLNAEEMTAKIAAGGDSAKEGLGQVLDGLRAMEDPVARNIAGVALFGTQWEDLGDAVGALDLSTAVASLDGVTGAAQRMFDTMADNDATKMEEAKRNIEVAADGMKGALAAAFSEPLAGFADYVSANRGPMLQFFQDLVNGAIDFAVAANTGIGDFVSGPLASMIDGLATAIDWMNMFKGRPQELDDLRDSMRGFSDTTDDANEKLEGMRDKFNGFADAQVALGYVHDAAKRTAAAIDEVGVAADGSKLSMEGLDASNLTASESGRVLHGQIRDTIAALDEELAAAAAAGEGQAELAGRYSASTDAIVDQLVQMGLTEEQARDLIDTYAEVPGSKATEVSAPGAVAAKGDIDNMKAAIDKLPPEKQSKIRALLAAGDIAGAEAALAKLSRDRTVLIKTILQKPSTVITADMRASNPYYLNRATGGVVDFMAAGGIRGLNPMQPIAQMVPPNTWRVVGDRGDVPEAYVPLDGSPRSWAILMEALRRMGGRAMADGGMATVAGSATGAPVTARLAREDIDLLARTVVSMAQGVSHRTVDSALMALGRGV